MMIKKIYLFKGMVFCLIASILLSSLNIVGFAENSVSENINLSEYFNDDMIKKLTDSAQRGVTYPSLMYNGDSESINSEGMVELNEKCFELSDGLENGSNDVIRVNSDTGAITVVLSEKYVKSIDLLVSGTDSEGSFDVTLNYKNGDNLKKEFNAKKMDDQTGGFDVGKAIVTGGSVMRPRFVLDDKNLYLHISSADFEKIAPAESVVFNESDFEYHILAMNIYLYTAEEIAANSKNYIDEHMKIYENKTIADIDNTSLEEVFALLTALDNAYNMGLESVNEDMVKKVTYLYHGSRLYLQQKELRGRIDQLLQDKDFLSMDEEDIASSDISTLEQLIALYEEAEGVDTEYLKEALAYFQNPFDCVINIEDLSVLKSLKSRAEILKEQEELISKIDSIYPAYENTEVVSEADEENLLNLLNLFSDAQDIETDLTGYDINKIKKLYMSLKKVDPTYGYVDLSAYFNADTIARAGDEIDINTWFAGQQTVNPELTGYKTGLNGGGDFFPKAHIVSYIDKILTIKNNGRVTENPNTFDINLYLDDNLFKGTIKDSVYFSGEMNGTYGYQKLTIPMSEIYVKSLFFAASSFMGNSDFKATLNYTDGSSEITSVSVKTMDMINATTAASVVARWWTNGKRLEPVLHGGKYVLEAGTAVGAVGVYKIEVDSTKCLQSVTFDNSQMYATDVAVYAISEEFAITNLEMENYIKENIARIDLDNPSINDMTILKIIKQYAKELEKRFVFTGDYLPNDILAKINEIILSISTKSYRYDKNTIVSELAFSVPVSLQGIESKFTVTSGGKKVTNYTLNAAADAMSAVLTIVNDGAAAEYEITIAGDIKLKNHPEISLGNDYVYSVNVFDSIYASYNSGDFVIQNNSSVPQGIKAIVCGMQDESVVKSSGFDAVLASNEKISRNIDMTAYASTTAFVWDEKQKPMCFITAYKDTAKKTDKTADYKIPVLDVDELTVSGFTPTFGAGEDVTLLVTNTFGIVWAAGVKTNSDGYFEFNVNITEKAAVQSGYLTLTIGGEPFDDKETLQTVYYATETDRKTLIRNIKNTTDVTLMKGYIEKSKLYLSTSFAALNSVDQDSLAKRIIKCADEFNEEDSVAASKIIKREAILQAFKEGKTELWYKDGELLHSNVMEYENIDTDGVTLYAIYLKDINGEGKSAINNQVSGKDFENVDQLHTQLAKLCMLYAFKNHISGGTGYIQNALTEKNAEAAGITITNYLKLSDKTRINNALFNQSISSLNDIEDFIGSWTEPPATADKPSGVGSSSGGKSISTLGAAPPTVKTENIVNAAQEFYDLKNTHWAYDAVMYLANNSILSGYDDNLFRPDNTVTRAEFVTMICKLINPQILDAKSVFADVDDTSWFAPYVMTAYQNGWINGISEDSFAPNMSITRQDMCVILYRIINSGESGDLQFEDKDKIAYYAYNAVSVLNKSGLINGFEDNSFRPADNCTRAQAASILYRYINR